MFVLRMSDYAIPPFVGYYISPLFVVKNHPKVIRLKKFPLLNGVKETYRWQIIVKKGGRQEIQNILSPFRLTGDWYESYTNHDSNGQQVTRSKTNAYLFIQIVANDTVRNRLLLDDLKELWGAMGWNFITKNHSCGWISMRAVKVRNTKVRNNAEN